MDIRDQLQATLGTSYTLERELGGGGMSRVFVAEENALQRKVVVKVLPPELTAGVNVDRFKREILLAAKLQHPHIVPVLASGETNGLPYYTMPFVEGESLRVKLARDGACSITDAISVLRDVARALAYAHERGIVHRDIKPENVLLSGGSATVTDFGIAKAISASRTQAPNATLTQIGTSIGTPAYMAPEQAAADPATDHRADLYAFGCMAYELLTGRPPFVGRTPQKLLAAQMGEAPQPILELRPDTPPELAEIVMRCLAKDADHRPQSATEVVRVLDSVTSGGGHAAMPPILLGGKHAMWRALALYAVAFVAVAILAKAAIVGIGLPDWVFPGAVIVMSLGLPVILFTGYVQHAARRLITMTPTYTPGGSAAPHGTMATIAMKASPHMSWRRTAKGGAYALGAFVALIGAFMLLRAFGIGPFGSLLAAGKLDANQPLVVAEFAVKGSADSALGGAIAEAVRTDLGESNAVTVLPASAIRDALQRMQRPADSHLDAALARQVAQRVGSKAVITGDLTPLGNGFLVTERIVAAASGNELASFQGTANAPSDLIPVVGTLTKQLRGRIGESLKSVQNSPPLEDVTTASLEALKLYTEGARASDAGDTPRAVALLKQALAQDSTFSMAWRKLGVAYGNAGWSPDLVNDALTNAYKYRDHLTPREQYTMVGTYFDLGPRPDRARSIEGYQAALNLGDFAVAASNLSAQQRAMRQFAAAESTEMLAIRHSVTASPINYQNLGIVLMDEGRWRAADSALQAGMKQFGYVSLLDGMRAVPAYATGNEDSLTAILTRTGAAADPSIRSIALSMRASLAERGGQLDAWRRMAAAASAANRAGGGYSPPLEDSVQAAFMDAWFRGQPERAVRTLDASLALYPMKTMPVGARPYADAASVYALANRPDKAKAMLAELVAAVPDTVERRPFETPRHQALGLIALAEKRPQDALREFRVADTLSNAPAAMADCTACQQFYIGMAFDEAQQTDSAIAAFQRYLGLSHWRMMFIQGDNLAYTYRRLGALYEAKGDRANAATYYTKFVELWKHADPDLQPQVAEVNRRLAHLTDTEKRP
ncbi:MAG: protein kinase [Gemmatimonadota bacterium]|nr:protein kinase [Gemmatimonadota bacterium]HEU4989656.1 protein kinase [Gemmatimonadaceae bacterium]